MLSISASGTFKISTSAALSIVKNARLIIFAVSYQTAGYISVTDSRFLEKLFIDKYQ